MNTGRELQGALQSAKQSWITAFLFIQCGDGVSPLETKRRNAEGLHTSRAVTYFRTAITRAGRPEPQHDVTTYIFSRYAGLLGYVRSESGDRKSTRLNSSH